MLTLREMSKITLFILLHFLPQFESLIPPPHHKCTTPPTYSSITNLLLLRTSMRGLPSLTFATSTATLSTCSSARCSASRRRHSSSNDRGRLLLLLIWVVEDGRDPQTQNWRSFFQPQNCRSTNLKIPNLPSFQAQNCRPFDPSSMELPRLTHFIILPQIHKNISLF